MKCRSCGHLNEERNRFCGSCGATLEEERRRAERRIIAWEPQQCRSCGSTNSAANRFCGMCGRALESERRVADRRTAVETPRQPGVPRRAEQVRVERPLAAEPSDETDDSHEDATSYLGAPTPSSSKPRSEWVRSSGSSFLGLEDEAPSNSEYLLADEEEPNSGKWRLPIALLILAAVGYLIFKNWDSPTFAAALSQLHRHTQDASSTQSKPQPPSSVEQPSISGDEASTSPDSKQSTPPATDANKAAPDANKAAPTEPSAAARTSDNDARSKQEAESKKGSADATPAKDDQETDNPPVTESEAKTPPSPKSAERANASSNAMPGQELYERGQAYLSGHGAPQSCDQGVVYTRAAAQQGNPKAAVQMGALYATGRCVSQDRVQAYNWFNEALRNDPNNEYVERSRATLWAQMTTEERQRASKE